MVEVSCLLAFATPLKAAYVIASKGNVVLSCCGGHEFVVRVSKWLASAALSGILGQSAEVLEVPVRSRSIVVNNSITNCARDAIPRPKHRLDMQFS